MLLRKMHCVCSCVLVCGIKFGPVISAANVKRVEGWETMFMKPTHPFTAKERHWCAQVTQPGKPEHYLNSWLLDSKAHAVSSKLCCCCVHTKTHILSHVFLPNPMKSELYHPRLRDDEIEDEKLMETSVSEMNVVHVPFAQLWKRLWFVLGKTLWLSQPNSKDQLSRVVTVVFPTSCLKEP